MFVFLSKLLPLFVYPLGLACLLLATGLIVRGRRLRRVLGLLALLVLLSFSNQPVANALVSSLEWQYMPAVDPPQVDAIVLLGGGTRPAIAPRIVSEVNEAGDRLLDAARLYHAGRAPVVVVSGGFIEFLGSTVPEAEAMQELLGLLGVPQDAVWLEARSRNTYENAVYVHELLAPQGMNRILLVTSALHMPRAVRIFANQGFDVLPAPTDYLTTLPDAQTPEVGIGGRLLALLPSAESLELATRALKEYIGIVIYRLRGWL